MRNCAICNKELSTRTKGQLCLQCYRNRSHIFLDADDNSSTTINKEIPRDSLQDSSMNASNIIPLFNGNELNDKAVINLLQQKMVEERIRDTEFIDTLQSHINFMKAEIINKNKLINKLLMELTDKEECLSSRNTSQRSKNNFNTLSSTTTTTEVIDESLSDISRCSLSDTLFNTNDINNKYDRQLANYRYEKQDDFYKNKRDKNENLKSDAHETNNYNQNQIADWELHSTGFASRMLKKMGYAGKGLGKTGEGIIHPVSIEKKSKFNPNDKKKIETFTDHTNNTHIWPRGTTLITGSSIISGIKEGRLTKYKAKVRAFPGATVIDMYDFLKPLLRKKPTYIILQIGTNDAPFKSYKEIEREISELIAYIYSILPETRLFT